MKSFFCLVDGHEQSDDGSSKTDASNGPTQSAGGSLEERADGLNPPVNCSSSDGTLHQSANDSSFASEADGLKPDKGSSETDSLSRDFEEVELGIESAVSPTTAEINGKSTDILRVPKAPFFIL